MSLHLLPPDVLVRTGDVDHAAWNYRRGLLGYVSRQRFRLVCRLLPPVRVRRLLEVGYGSGIFMPQLRDACEELFGADVHAHDAEVRASLRHLGVEANLVQAPAESLPFGDGTFDVVVAVSTFEFVSDARVAIREMARVLGDDGRVIVVTPGRSPLLDLALRVATGKSAAEDFGDRRELVVPALTGELREERSAYFPSRFPLPVYRALRLAKRRIPN